MNGLRVLSVTLSVVLPRVEVLNPKSGRLSGPRPGPPVLGGYLTPGKASGVSSAVSILAVALLSHVVLYLEGRQDH